MSNQHPPSRYGSYDEPATWTSSRRPVAIYARWGMRVVAYIVDLLVIAPFGIVAFVVLTSEEDMTGSPTPEALYLGLFVMLCGSAVSIWNVIFRQGRTGASLGKSMMGIRLLRESTGQPLGAGLTFVRQLCHLVDSLPCDIGYLWPLWDTKRQTFADKIVGSVVIAA